MFYLHIKCYLFAVLPFLSGPSTRWKTIALLPMDHDLVLDDALFALTFKLVEEVPVCNDAYAWGG